MDKDESTGKKKDKDRGMAVGCLTGPAAGFILIVIGAMVSLTGIGLIIGIPLILCGIAYPLIARSLIIGQCPYCGRKVSALGSKPGISCPACRKRIVIRDKKFFTAD